MQTSFEAKPVDVKEYEKFWVALGQCALKGKTWRLEYDPWEGFVLDANEHRLLLVLRNIAEPDLEIQVYVGRSLIPEQTYNMLAEGVWFQVQFKYDDADGPLMEFDFPFAS